ncbi:MAG: hypothetical protein J7K75_04385 [Desulfuromonas sp.]|nr:hypothetical protein [Desulfuromonas sp.]
MIPHLQYDQAPDYLIAGGLVFSPLTSWPQQRSGFLSVIKSPQHIL